MKKIALFVMLLSFSILLACGASALQITSATIGGESQDRIVNASTSVTVTNDGTSDLTGIQMSFIGDSKYHVRFEPASFDLTVGTSRSVTIYADIPLNHNAVERSESSSDYLKEKAFSAGTIKAAVGTNEATTNLDIRAVNQIRIKKVTAQCNDKSDRLSDGDRFKQLSPDMECTLTIEVENRFDDNDRDDIKIGDISFDPIYVEVESRDSDFDWDDSDDTGDIGGDEEDEIVLDFEIEDDVDDGTYSVDIRVFGTDDNGAFHGEMWTVKFEVDRLKHDIQIKGASLTPSKIDNCKDRKVTLDAVLINLGKRDEDNVLVQVVVSDLDITDEIKDIQLDEDDSKRISFVFNIPQETEEGIYTIEMNTFFDTTALSRVQTFDLVVEACEDDTTIVVTPDDTTTTTDTTTTPVTTSTTTRASVRSADSSFKDSPVYLWLLLGIGLLLAFIVIVLLVVLFRKPLE
jgi:hypothetical protein